ncbi:MAG: PQQ-binding-like beta-propeller repeat protein [Planctomycetaceae bacterium]|nr:PQQ-binding-like beta-propeller repeat protein [Planctomycetaceae bacterium]
MSYRATHRSATPQHLSPLAIAFVLALLSHQSLMADDWPQFRGPNCTGISATTKSLPAEFSATKNVQWSADVGDGVGGPVVAAGRTFVCGMVGDEAIRLSALDAATGTPLWHRDWPTGKLPEVHKTNSHASTTPAADADRVYFYFSTLGLIALDAKTGAEVWRQKLPTPFFVFKWGPAMSPVLYQDKVLFCQDDDLFPAFYAFDKKTGKELWKDERDDMAVNYSHPVVCETEQGDEIVVAGTGLLIGYDPDTGKRLWQSRTLLRNIKTTPVSHDGTIYISLQSSGIANQWLATADRSETGNSDGKLSKAEMQAFVGETKIPEVFYKKTFDRGDANQDGVLEGAELDIAFLSPDNFAGATFEVEDPANEFVLAVRGGGRGDVTDSHLLWKHETKYTDHIVSPYVRDGRMLLVKGGGITTLFETSKGESLRDPKRIPNASEYFASPIYGDGKVFIAGENGFVVVLKDGPDYDVLAKNDMGDSIIGTPAIADGRLFIRTRSRLIVVGQD